MTETSRSGIPLKAFYTCADRGVATDEVPGAYPFTRGRLRPAQAGHGWIHRELSGEGDARRSNAQLRYLIGLGQSGVDVIGDAPTQSMIDADHPLVAFAVGTQGVSLSTQADHVELLRYIAIDRVSVSSSVPAMFALSGLLAAAEQHDVPADKLRGSVLQPPLYAADASYSCGMPVALMSRIAADSIVYATARMPRFHAYVEDTYFFSECGLDAVEEMALGFVQIRHLVREVIRRGVTIDSFAPRIAILVNCSMNLFEEVAKIRASRRIFARMMREEFGARDPRSLSVVVTSHTSGLTLTAQQPINNVVRGTVQGLALALAGVQAMEISAFDEGYRTPSAEAHLVALRTQQILAEESGVTRVADPLGGSHFVETLTDEIEHRIIARVREIEDTGDPVELAEHGYFRRLFEEAAARHAKAVGDGSRRIVGVNCHRMVAEDDRLLRDVTERKIAPCREAIAALRRFKAERAADAVRRSLRALHATAADGNANLMPAVHEAFGAGATMGEIAGALRLVYGAPYDPYGALEPEF